MGIRRILMAPVIVLVLAAPLHAALAVSFSGTHVHITGVTSNGKVAVVAVMREAGRYMLNRLSETQQLLSDDDGDGVVDYDLGRAVPERSLWAVVDVTSGQSIIAAPGDFPKREVPLPSGFVKNLAADEIDSVIGDRLILHVLWVRPGKGGGAWFVRAADGGANDSDGRGDGKTITTTASFASLDATDKEKAPKKLKKDDVLIILDPLALTFSRGTVQK